MKRFSEYKLIVPSEDGTRFRDVDGTEWFGVGTEMKKLWRQGRAPDESLRAFVHRVLAFDSRFNDYVIEIARLWRS